MLFRSVEDLRLFCEMFDGMAAAITEEKPQARISPKRLGNFLKRLDRPKIKPRKFKQEFIQAYQAREHARRGGKAVTHKTLAQTFTRNGYERNPESAIRGMGRAMRSIGLDRKRFEALGMEYPYDLSEQENQK